MVVRKGGLRYTADEDIVYSLSKDKGAKAQRGSSVPVIMLFRYLGYLTQLKDIDTAMEEFINQSGIYMCTCLSNGLSYIGQAQFLLKRQQQHISSLKNGRHYNLHLQRAWNKYGEYNFDWKILELCSVDELDEREQYWIDRYNTFENGFNQTLGGNGKRGYRESDETKAKHAIATRDSWTPERRKSQQERMSGSNNPMFNKVGALNPAFGTKRSGSKDGMYGKHHTEEAKEKNRQAHLGGKNKNSKAVICIETGDYFSSQGEAGRAKQCDSATINKCCRGVKRTAGGFHWRYATDAEITLNHKHNIPNE